MGTEVREAFVDIFMSTIDLLTRDYMIAGIFIVSILGAAILVARDIRKDKEKNKDNAINHK